MKIKKVMRWDEKIAEVELFEKYIIIVTYLYF